MAHVTVSVVTEVLGHDVGHWCRDCLLPSGIRQWLVMRFPTGRMLLVERGWCDECGGHALDVTSTP